MRPFRKAKRLASFLARAAFAPAAPKVDPQILDLFDSRWYGDANGDVAAAGLDPLTHFLNYGEAEGRDPNPSFSTQFYRETYMPGAPVNASPLQDYVLRGRGLGHDPDPESVGNYRRQVAAREQRYGLELPELRRRIGLMIAKPLFVIYLSSDAPASDRVRDALRSQIYDRWVLCDTLDEIFRQVKPLQPGDWRLIWLDGGETLHSGALYAYASKINESPSADLIYADDDVIDDAGNRSRPFFKPDWSPDYFESFDFVGAGACLSGRVAKPALSEARSAYDLMLRATEAACKIEHIRHILIHRAAALDAPRSPEQAADEIEALRGRLRRTARAGIVTPMRPGAGCYEVRLTLAARPLVSIVIPTAGATVAIEGRPVDLALNCLEKLATTRTYENIEIIVIHNDDLGPARLEALAERGVKLIAYRGEPNVARKINLGATQSRGEYLLLMNDDIEPLTPDWIERMLEQFEKPHVGVVGAKLLFPGMKIQHAGVVLIEGKPDHLRFKYPRDDEGYFFSTCAVRNFTAVTGAVMMTRASLFRQIGGYTEALPINFNDVDYCLKAAQAGYTTVYTPHAELTHYESMSRTREVSPHELEFFQKRWAGVPTDPYYNEAMLKRRGPNYQVVPSARMVG